ncbi:MAG: cation transporter [Bdellovibrionaceae bacterium]|nr:cation transporter [Pseudobdellovibrionaceae bacterium]
MAQGHMDVNSNEKSRILLAQTSFALSVVLFGLKYWAYYLTMSHAVLSDALETIVNILASIVALWVVRWSARPADEQHPYGHGKAELLSATFEGGLVSAAAVFILIESFLSFFKPHHLDDLGLGLYITFGAAILNGLMGWILIVRGKHLHSSALVASGVHLLSDLVTSLGSILGLSLVMFTRLVIFDTIAAAAVGLYLLYTGFKVMKGAIGGLLDKTDAEAIKRFNQIINTQRADGIIQIHHVRMIISGAYYHIDAHVVVPEYWDVKETHAITIKYEHELLNSYGAQGELHFHVDPCEQNYCHQCSVHDCPIRLKPFEKLRIISVEEMLDKDEPVQNGANTL